MARDFAKVETVVTNEKRPSKASKHEGSESSSMLPALGVVALLCFAAGYWLGGGSDTYRHYTLNSSLEDGEALLEEERANSALLRKQLKIAEDQLAELKARMRRIADGEVASLDFYQTLPEQSVVPEPVVKTKPAPQRTLRYNAPKVDDGTAEEGHPPHLEAVKKSQPSTTAQTGYRIQVASFRRHRDAVTMKKKLEKHGIDVSIHQAELSDRGSWVRLYAGPFTTKGEAVATMRKLNESFHIQGILLRVR